MKKEFYEKPIYTIPNYILGLIQSSFYFGICNILLILFFIITNLFPDQFNILLFVICLIPLGPSLGALYPTISKIIREKDIYFASYFWRYYKSNFRSYLKLWSVHLGLITLFSIDFEYFYINSPETNLHIIFVVLLILSVLINLYSFSINSRFELKLKDLFVLSIYYMIKKFPITILKVSVIFFAYYLSNNISILLLFFMPSIICYIFFYYDKKIFEEIENRFMSHNNFIPIKSL